MGAAGCNLEDTSHPGTTLRDRGQHAEWLRAVRAEASDADYPLIVNARVDDFLWPYVAEEPPGHQLALVPDAVQRAHAYLEAGADCVYPIALWEPDALDRFMSEVDGSVNLAMVPQLTSVADLAEKGVARLSWAIFLHVEALANFQKQLKSITSETGG